MKLERAWMVAAACSLFAVQFIGCGTDPKPTTSSSSSSGGGGEAGSGGSGGNGGGSASSSSGMPPECTVAADCKNNGVADFCGEPECTAGKCGRKGLQAPGTALPSQLYGDCLQKQCDNAFNIVEVPVDDVYDDAKSCTTDVCSNGVLAHDPVAASTLCNKVDGSNGVCDGMGACVSCLDGSMGCSANFTCQMNKCVGAKCTNGTKDPGEGDVDCGVGCLPCADGKTCTQGAQCASGSCMTNLCAPAACPDGILNGKETDFDCGGGDCAKCADEQRCLIPSDCQSGVCQAGICIKPACTDAVQNADEAGIDCGGSCPTPCP